MHVLFGDVGIFDRGIIIIMQHRDDGLHEVFGSGSAGGQQKRIHALEPIVVDLGDIIDEISPDTAVLGDFDEAEGIGGVL